MTAQSIITSATAELRESEYEEKGVGLLEELRAMSKAMVKEEGLLNHAQAALVLDVSTRRIGELVDAGKFRRFEFLGRTYVSLSEVMERRSADIKAGRPPRRGVAKVKAAIQIASRGDLANTALEMLFLEEIEKERKKRISRK